MSSPSRSVENMVENWLASLLPVLCRLPLMMLYTGPVAMITGRKNTARENVRPLNFWFRITATNRENTRISGVFHAVSFSTFTRY